MSLFSSLFKTTKTPTYKGVTPYNELLDAPGGKEYYNTLLDRLAGRNVGFGDSYASKYANPIIQNSRQQFEDYQIPELTSELSATGRRRGSGGFDQIRRAYQEQGNTEGDVFSRLQQRNEDQSRQEINNALTGIGSFNQAEANTRLGAANFDKNVYDSNTKAGQYDNEQNQAKAQRIGQAAVQIGAAPFTGGASLGMGDFSNPFQQANPAANYVSPNAGYQSPNNPFTRMYRRAQTAQTGRIQ